MKTLETESRTTGSSAAAMVELGKDGTPGRRRVHQAPVRNKKPAPRRARGAL
jgi:hypothetical protein